MRRGFTLAEVLITLGIIGVVAALTLPSLRQQINYQQYVTSLRKIHSELSQSVQKAMYDNGSEKWSDTNISMRDFLSKYFRTSGSAGSAVNGFIGDTGSFKNVDGTNGAIGAADCAFINSGASICFAGKSEVFVDVNGKEGPNIGGRDIFALRIENDGTVNGWNSYSSSHSNSISVYNAFARIVYDGWKMTY